MSYYIIEYNTGSQDSGNWTELTSSGAYTQSVGYSGSVPQSALNEYLVSVLGKTKAYFRTYITGSNTGSALSEFQISLVGGTSLSFTSYYTIKEHKYICVVNRGEFNNTQNPSLYDISGSVKSEIIQIDSEGNNITTIRDEYFHTFATGIGLYDDSLQLVAYAKFANPIKIEKNFDSVFIVKFDV